MLKVTCINDEEQTDVKHKCKNVMNGITYKAQALGNSIYMIWFRDKYMGVFNQSRFVKKGNA